MNPPQAFKLARRTEPFQESVIREMTRLGDEAGAINLSQGLPDFNTPTEVYQAAVHAIQSGDNQYSFPFGQLEFRQAISRKTKSYNHIAADPESEVTVTCGVSEAMISTLLALTDPGDEVIIFEPWYENYLPDCHLAGVTPRFVPLRGPDYTFDLAELQAAFSSRTRLILINTPHNPTGRVYLLPELQEIARLCQKFGVIAVTDEIYEHIYYEEAEHISIGSLPGMEDRTVTISGLGKTYAVTGWRVGWTVAHAGLTALIRKVHDYLTICAPSPFQVAGITALEMPASYYAELRQQYEQRRQILLPALRQAGFSFRDPQGAYYVMADYSEISWEPTSFSREGWTVDRAFSEFMARKVGVAVVPGSSFYADHTLDSMKVRFNFAKQEETLREVAHRLAFLSNT